MRRWFCIAVLAFGCSNEPPPVSAVVVEIPAQPPQPPPTPTSRPTPPPTPSAEPEATEPEPWSNGLPPASGVVAQPPPKPLSNAASTGCAIPYWYDATGVKHYKPQCLTPMPTAPLKPYKTPPIN